LLGRAEESLGYWKEMHEKYMQRDELEERRKWLKREAAWVRVIKQEAASKQLEERLKVKEYTLLSCSEEMENARVEINRWREKLDSWKINYKEHLYELLHLEKEEAAELNEREKEIGIRAKELKEAIKKLQSVLGAVDRSLESNLDKYITFRVKGEVLKFKRGMLETDIKALKSELEKANHKLADLASLKKKAGERIDTERKQSEIENELNMVAARIDALGEIPEETEEIYSNYSKLFDELKDKSEIVASNKREGLKELESRRKIWRKAICGVQRIPPSPVRLLYTEWRGEDIFDNGFSFGHPATAPVAFPSGGRIRYTYGPEKS
jgi:chromosome segregation ATPase